MAVSSPAGGPTRIRPRHVLIALVIVVLLIGTQLIISRLESGPDTRDYREVAHYRPQVGESHRDTTDRLRRRIRPPLAQLLRYHRRGAARHLSYHSGACRERRMESRGGDAGLRGPR